MKTRKNEKKVLMNCLLAGSLTLSSVAFAEMSSRSALGNDPNRVEETGTTVTSIPSKTTQQKMADADKENKSMRKTDFPMAVVKDAEKALKDSGYKMNSINGKIDIEEQAAISDYQKKNKLNETGILDKETLEKLNIEYRNYRSEMMSE